MAPLLYLIACTPAPVRIGDEPAPTDTAAADTAGADTDTAVDTAPPPETWPKGCADLYDPDRLVTFELTVDPLEWEGLRTDCANGVQAYRPATFTFDGESAPAHVRLKGNWSWDCNKMQFVVSFNESDPEGRFHGLRKVVLDAPWYDRTLLHERTAAPLFQSLGLPYSCVNNARLVVNGSYYGLYANTERIDKEYLQRHFEEADGNLYQGGAELKTNEETGDTSRLAALQAAATATEVAALVDMDEALLEWATEAMLPALDNYWAGVEINYYLYDHPSRGFTWLPYDLDISFGDASWPDGSLLVPGAATVDPILYEHSGWRKEPLVQLVLADPALCARYVEALRTVRAAWDPVTMAAQVDRWDAQIRDAYAEDPRAHYRPRQRDEGVALLKAFFAERAVYVDAWLAQGGHCPARW